MGALFEDDYTCFEQMWRLLAHPSQLEADPKFRASLQEAMFSGFRFGGLALILGEAIYLGLSSVVIGIPLLHNLLIAVIGVGLTAFASLRTSLTTGRAVGAAATLILCGLSMHDDLHRGPDVATEFVTMLYFGAVVVIPFRPWQALGVGGGIVGLYILFGKVGFFVPEAVAEAVYIEGDAPFLVLLMMTGTAISAVLYAARWTQHRIRRTAEQELTEAKEETEQALSTVEEQAEKLREIDEMKSRFFANVSHELRTPLSLIRGPVEEMIKEERSESDRQALDLMSRNVGRLERLVEQLMDLARYDAGHLSVNAIRAEWADFVHQATQRFQPMAEAQGITLSVVTEAADAPVVFDPDHMETVTANLVRNALTYTPNGGAVTVTAKVDEDAAMLVVEDTGAGIPEDEQEALFERFYQGAGLAKRGGTGIGLSLTKALVTLHDGTIDVESTPGEGSRFTVSWPASLSVEDGLLEDGFASTTDTTVPPTRTIKEASNSTPDNGRSSNPDASTDAGEADSLVDRTTVLVVEDSDDMRQYVRQLLEPRYQVIVAKNGQEGLEKARASLPDLIVADVMMPELDGLTMLKRLRQRPQTKCIPMVVLTARAEESDQVDGLEGGAEAYVTKPFAPDVLTAQIDRLLTSYHELREQYKTESSNSSTTERSRSEPPSFEERVRRAARTHLSDPDFSVEALAEEVGCSHRTLTRRTKEAFGQTPSALLRTMRIEKGAEFLREKDETISEIAYAVGFNSLSYFSQRFKKHFGLSPSAYRTENT